jgi:uncharacterized membrane protein YqjE
VRLLIALPRLAPVLARHALGYADLAAEELDSLGDRLRTRLVATLACTIAASVAVLMLCFLAIAIAWDTPYRTTVVAGLAVAFAVAAVVTGALARRERQKSASAFPRLSIAWNRDRELLREVLAARERLL